MKAFEIQTFSAGKWRIDSVFDDRELAMFEARRIDQSTRYAGVRVVEETFDESSQLSTARTIFRGGSAERVTKPEGKKEERAGQGRSKARRANAKRSVKGRKKPPAEKKSGLTVPLLFLAAIVVIGIGALFGLQELSGAF